MSSSMPMGAAPGSSDYHSEPLRKVKRDRTDNIKRKYDATSNKSYYSSKSLPYDKRNISHNSQSQVAKFRATYKEISPDSQQIVDQIIDPEMTMSVSRIPSYGVSATYTAHNILQSNYDSNGRSCVVVNPNLTDAIFATAGTTFAQNLVPVGSANNPYSSQIFNLPEDTTAAYSSPIFFQSSNVSLPFPNSQTGRLLYAINANMAGSNTAVIGFQATDVSTAARLSVTVIRYDGTFNTISSGTTTLSASGAGSITLFPTPAADGAEYIAIEVKSLGIPYIGSLNLYFADSAGTFFIGLGNQAQHCYTYSVSGASDIENSAERFIMIAQSVKLTYQGSDLQNGGQMAAARLPGDTIIGEKSGLATADNWYSYLANLSRNSYNGPVKDGAYVFYLPDDQRGYFYRPVNTLTFDGLSYMCAEWTSEGSPTQTVRIMVTSVVQFTSNNNVFDTKPSPYLGCEWEHLLHILSCVNAAYDNPGHRAKLTAALKKIGGKVIGLLKNPKTYTTLGSIVAALA